MSRSSSPRLTRRDVSVLVSAIAGLLRVAFGTYLEVFILSGLLCIGAALAVLLIGQGRDREPVAAPVAVG